MTKHFDLENAITMDLYRCKGVCWMLIHTIGTHSEEDRVETEFILNSVEYLAQTLNRISAHIDMMTPGVGAVALKRDAEFAQAVYQARGIATAFDTVIWADGCKIFGSDDIVSGILSAIDDRLDTAYDLFNNNGTDVELIEKPARPKRAAAARRDLQEAHA